MLNIFTQVVTYLHGFIVHFGNTVACIECIYTNHLLIQESFILFQMQSVLAPAPSVGLHFIPHLQQTAKHLSQGINQISHPSAALVRFRFGQHIEDADCRPSQTDWQQASVRGGRYRQLSGSPSSWTMNGWRQEGRGNPSLLETASISLPFVSQQRHPRACLSPRCSRFLSEHPTRTPRGIAV